jgi:hypothetical protein
MSVLQLRWAEIAMTLMELAGAEEIVCTFRADFASS